MSDKESKEKDFSGFFGRDRSGFFREATPVYKAGLEKGAPVETTKQECSQTKILDGITLYTNYFPKPKSVEETNIENDDTISTPGFGRQSR